MFCLVNKIIKIYIATENMTRQFDLFLNIHNFELAFKGLQTSRRDLYKDLYHEDMKLMLLNHF